MFIIFSPYSFLYFSFYLLILFSLFQLSGFFYYWAVIEVIILLFIGISYTVIIRSYSQLIVYFLIQTIASFLILAFYIFELGSLLTIALLMKLSMFPFFIWYINIIYRFSNYVFWLASTLHKIPPMLIIKVFSLAINWSLVWLSIFFTTFVVGFIMLSTYDFRILLVLSSIGNNSWFILSQISFIWIFIFYLFVYRISLLMLLLNFGTLTKLQMYSSLNMKVNSFSFWVLTISGMPPFPLFYFKVLVIMRLFSFTGFNYLFFLFIASRALIFMGYLRSLITYYIYCYSSGVLYLLKL